MVHTREMLKGLPEISAHFGRFRVTEIALSERALGQFDDSEILRAAELLSHAKLHCIGYPDHGQFMRCAQPEPARPRRLTARSWE